MGARRVAVAYLVVLDGEQDKALGIFPQDRLIKFLWAELWCFGRRLLCLDHSFGGGVLRVDVLGQGGNRGVLDVILLVGDAKVELLDWSLYLKRLNGRSSLLVI